MLISELMDRLQEMVLRHGDLPVFDWDNDEITTVLLSRRETLAYGGCPIELRVFPDRIVLKP